MASFIFISLGILAVLCLSIYAIGLNYEMGSTPTEAAQLAGERLSTEEIKATYARVQKNGIDFASLLPPKKDRRYIVVGGSGIVGGQIILHLLAMGTPPEAIRIIDIGPPIRASEFAEHPASAVALIRADITSQAVATSAFAAPWPPSTSRLPLTVFHTAAVIRPFERHPLLYHRSYNVNVNGTANVLSAAQAVKADLFIYTSSCTVNHLPVDFFPLPKSWTNNLRRYFQILTTSDFSAPVRPHSEFATNYAHSKAEAERLVSAANDSSGMRTGILRPGNAVYGHHDDKVLGRMLALGFLPSFGAGWAQSWISASNASVAHLQHEDALLGPHGARLRAKPFLVTDAGPPLRLADIHKILDVASATGLKVVYPPPLLMLVTAYIVETWAIAVFRLPLLRAMLGEPHDPVILFQPAVFSAAVSAVVDDSESRRSPERGGIEYRPACTSLEGMCLQVSQWNDMLKIQART